MFDLVRITGCRRRGLDRVRVSWRTIREGARYWHHRRGPTAPNLATPELVLARAMAVQSDEGGRAAERGGALQAGRARWSRSGSRSSRARAAPSGGGGERRRRAGSGARWSAGGRPSEVDHWRPVERGGAPRQCGAGVVSATHCAPAMRARA